MKIPTAAFAKSGGTQPRSYLIIGGGAFGAPTALALKKARPEVDVTVVDSTPYPSPYGAGHDLNKICRGDYGDLMYMKLAVKALTRWESDPLYKPHFCKTGMLYAYDKPYLDSIIANWETLNGQGKAPSCLIPIQDAKRGFKGIFQDADWSLAEQSMFSPTAGWADSAAALRTIMQAAVKIGVKYHDEGAHKLLFGEDGACVGISTFHGHALFAEKIVLAAGAYIPLLLADSAPDRPDIQVGQRLIAVGAAMCAYKIPEELMEKFEDTPVMALMARLPAECVPPGDKQLLKCTHDTGFSNLIWHEKSKQEISTPPAKRSQLTWSDDMPTILKEELRGVLTELYGEWTREIEPRFYRMCWDGFTPNQDWIMCPHPAVDNLYIVGGGSFHGFKFLPVIGDLVVDMIEGRLDEEMQRRFAWDRPNDGNNSPQYIPKRDLKDLW